MYYRYGCIKKGCQAKLYVAANHDVSTIKIMGLHSCLKSTHERLERKQQRLKLKENADNHYAGTSKKIFDETCLQ